MDDFTDAEPEPERKRESSNGSTPSHDFDLAKRAKLWLTRLTDGATGPLFIAEDIRTVNDNWHIYKASCGGLSCATWFRKTMGPGRSVSHYVQLAEILDSVGPIGKRLHHQTLFWLSNKVSDSPTRILAVKELVMWSATHNGALATPTTARRELKKLIGDSTRPAKRCSECARLRGLLTKHGIVD